jgi:hypothetical protein
MDAGSGWLQFFGPLNMLGKNGNWYVIFFALPDGLTYDQMRKKKIGATEYVQAAGAAEKMAVEIRKLGGEQWGAKWVRYGIGHQHEGTAPVDVTLELPLGPEMISAPEVFAAEETAQIFMSYYKTGEIPDGYMLRPIEGYTADGDLIDLRGVASV